MSETGAVEAALLGSDLIMASRLEAALGPLGVRLARASRVEALPRARVVFVDLNARETDRIDAIGWLRSRHPVTVIVGFCDHDERERRRLAVAAGADQVIANRHLAEAAARLVGAAASGAQR